MGFSLTLKLDTPVGGLALAAPTIQIDNGQTIRELKNDIQDMNGVPYEQQLLLYSKNVLDDSRTVEFYGIQDGNKIQLGERPTFALNLP